MNNLLTEFWGALAATVAGLVWLVRLEGRSLANEREIRRLWAQRREDLASAHEDREEVKSSLKEIKADIKSLLMGGHE